MNNEMIGAHIRKCRPGGIVPHKSRPKVGGISAMEFKRRFNAAANRILGTDDAGPRYNVKSNETPSP